MCRTDFWRLWSIRWLYLITLGHFFVGILMTWWGDSSLLLGYHHAVLENFALSLENKNLHLWWLSIFGATLQVFSIFLLLLIYLGDKYQNPIVWLVISIALLVWAPQDIYFSAIKNIEINVWVDTAALISFLPALVFLFVRDKSSKIK